MMSIHFYLIRESLAKSMLTTEIIQHENQSDTVVSF